MKVTQAIWGIVLVSGMLTACTSQDDAQEDVQGAAWPQAQPDVSPGDGASMLARTPVDTGGRASPQLPQLDTSRLVTIEIMDQSGFGRPMAMGRLQIPAGWQASGGVSWNDAANCHANMVQTAWSAIGPDSLSVIEIQPNFGWQVAGTQIQTDPCPVAPFRSAREFLQATAQQSRPGARILDYVDRTDWAQETKRRVDEQMRQMGVSLPPGQTRRIEAGSVLLAFRQDGIEMREMLSAVVSFVSMRGNVSGLANNVVSYRAPDGRLDLGLINRIIGTMEPDKQWQDMAMPRMKRNIDQYFGGQRRKIDEWHSRQMAIINARGMADRHAIRMRTNREVAGIYNAIAASNSATSDRIHKQNMEAIGEYNTYAGVQGTQVQSSIHGGGQVFQSTHDPSKAYSTDAPYPNPPSDYVELQRDP